MPFFINNETMFYLVRLTFITGVCAALLWWHCQIWMWFKGFNRDFLIKSEMLLTEKLMNRAPMTPAPDTVVVRFHSLRESTWMMYQGKYIAWWYHNDLNSKHIFKKLYDISLVILLSLKKLSHNVYDENTRISICPCVIPVFTNTHGNFYGTWLESKYSSSKIVIVWRK